ncbi:mitochondrial ubiquitin ligase activator of nfkb 1-A isoform X3 [Siniperca chuatsi]|uniref:mitochondrial ubiquitin ligase activator of nfkb 1-A isoform X3 n=1 Tax=Siniperca chuatsi TaxID=119488 RepID=UPI001CE0EDE3|nr:mitochondrial ubiquitin ligase activator of nfkb 1-A isoform X3 [Siniperca chuatsi]XP_044075121.1 mitochondrial ubiquitin ligase activator of nfkb 1-A isoform X3 [Siniperca chuatsi]XP_044075122.1 mitochondrial ubiquitin ligase activator of nfkb 1-A isoform X3 [Siniperca chuatsi]
MSTVCCHRRCCATSGRASDESFPKRNCRRVAKIHVERTQAGVEWPFTHLIVDSLEADRKQGQREKVGTELGTCRLCDMHLKETDSERVLHQRVNAVPFVLMGSDENTVKVLCPLQASGVHMEITHEKFHQVNYGLGDIVGQYLSGEKLKGQLETEEMLKVGTTLTGIGELILDTDGTLNLRPPSNGSQYFLSIADFDTLRGEQETTAVWWKVLATASALVGAGVLLWVGRRYYYQLKVRWEREQERREFERLQAEAPRVRAPVTGPEAPQDRAEEHIENACVICLCRPRDCILLDCGHVCCCHSCYQALPHRRCPICRQNISRVVPLYHV